MWYLYDLLGIYLLLPMLRVFVATTDRRNYEFVLIALFIFGCVVPTINDLLGAELKNVLWLGKSAFYALLGRYLYVYVEINPRVIMTGILCLAANVALTGVGIVTYGAYWSALASPASPLVVAYSTMLFLVAKKYCNKPMKQGGVGRTISRLSFGIYLVHPVFANLLYKALNWANAPLPPIIFEMATYLLVFVPSALLALTLSKMPLFRRLL
jgi:surface polysaccharide O-acyltransferase-like enzyme